MRRAAVLISVKKTVGNPAVLQATKQAADAMYAWARAQGFDFIKLISDEQRPVEASDIKKSIASVLQHPRGFHQLVVYFTGHGINNGNAEYWLLSEAPRDTNAAVSVVESVALARRCTIPHVVLISDACRTPAQGIEQYVKGSEIFPNEPQTNETKDVDQFFATTTGSAAVEVKDRSAVAAAYSAVYTEVLAEALEGQHPSIVDEAHESGTTVGLVRLRPLRRFLPGAVASRLGQKGVSPTLRQTPDALIVSEPSAWLSRFGVAPARRAVIPSPTPPPMTLLSATQATLRTMLEPGFEKALRARFEGELPILSAAAEAGVPHAELVARAALAGARTFGPAQFETGCGFKIQGARIIHAFSKTARIERLHDDRVLITAPPPAGNVLLVTDRGAGIVLPAIPEFVTALTFDGSELVSVSYEPSVMSYRWGDFQHQMTELRALRGLIAASARFGVFRLDGDDAGRVARRMQVAKGVDPAMALYAAYAYHALDRRDRLREMQTYLLDDLNLRFFDIALLTGTTGVPVPPVFPFVPMLAQGWALLRAHRARIPDALEGARGHLVPSLWTVFDARGVEVVRNLMASGEVS